MEIIYPVYYIIKIVHRNGTDEYEHVLGKPEMSSEEVNLFLTQEKTRIKTARKSEHGNSLLR